MEKDDFWRNIVNNIEEPMPESGQGPPPEELNPPKKKKGQTSNSKVMVQRVNTEIYIITDINNKTFASQTSQTTHLLGEMTLSEALKMMHDKNNKK